jgi:hypothetical protein
LPTFGRPTIPIDKLIGYKCNSGVDDRQKC